MMSTPLHVHRLVPCAVMEKLCFLFADPVEKEVLASTAPEDLVHVVMEFTGPVRGRLTMVLPHELCVEVAANALGGDDDEEAMEKALDATGELLNVMCGQVLVALCGPVPIFDLTPPRVNRGGEKIWEEILASDDSVAYRVDRWPMVLDMSVEDDVS